MWLFSVVDRFFDLNNDEWLGKVIGEWGRLGSLKFVNSLMDDLGSVKFLVYYLM